MVLLQKKQELYALSSNLFPLSPCLENETINTHSRCSNVLTLFVDFTSRLLSANQSGKRRDTPLIYLFDPNGSDSSGSPSLPRQEACVALTYSTEGSFIEPGLRYRLFPGTLADGEDS